MNQQPKPNPKDDKMDDSNIPTMVLLPTTTTTTTIATTTLRTNDVLLGRGTGPNNHVGNVRFRRIIYETYHEYITATKGGRQQQYHYRRYGADLKNDIARLVLQRYKETKDGRFVRKVVVSSPNVIMGSYHDISTGSTIYQEVPDKLAMEKIKQSLRFLVEHKEGKLDIPPRPTTTKRFSPPTDKGGEVCPDGDVVASSGNNSSIPMQKTPLSLTDTVPKISERDARNSTGMKPSIQPSIVPNHPRLHPNQLPHSVQHDAINRIFAQLAQPSSPFLTGLSRTSSACVITDGTVSTPFVEYNAMTPSVALPGRFPNNWDKSAVRTAGVQDHLQQLMLRHQSEQVRTVQSVVGTIERILQERAYLELLLALHQSER